MQPLISPTINKLGWVAGNTQAGDLGDWAPTI